MNILVLGATGFIGSHLTTALMREDHQVICGVRDVKYAKKQFPQCKVIKCDFQRDTNLRVWKSRLVNIDVIINCVGIFYHPNKKIIWNIHYETPRAIFDAAFQANVKKIIHISALNSELYSVEYAKSKKAAEDFLLNSGVPAIILKPSLVYGKSSSGGMKLFKMLASFPFFLVVPGKVNPTFQPIHVDDLTQAIIKLANDISYKNKVLSAVSVTPISLLNILKMWRKWLGLSKAYVIHIPIFILKISNYFYDLIPYSLNNSDALMMLNQNNTATRQEAHHFEQEIGFKPRDFKNGLLLMPSDTQDRWYSLFVIARPILKLSLAFMWIMSALTSAFLYPLDATYRLLSTIGVGASFQPLLLYGACLINLLIGVTLLFNYKTQLNYIIQLVVIVTYTSIITVKLPYLWLEPFGPIAKNIPLLALILFLYVLERDE